MTDPDYYMTQTDVKSERIKSMITKVDENVKQELSDKNRVRARSVSKAKTRYSHTEESTDEISKEQKKKPGDTVPFSRTQICESNIPCHAIFNRALNKVKRY
jgi:hypothetical protein